MLTLPADVLLNELGPFCDPVGICRLKMAAGHFNRLLNPQSEKCQNLWKFFVFRDFRVSGTEAKGIEDWYQEYKERWKIRLCISRGVFQVQNLGTRVGRHYFLVKHGRKSFLEFKSEGVIAFWSWGKDLSYKQLRSTVRLFGENENIEGENLEISPFFAVRIVEKETACEILVHQFWKFIMGKELNFDVNVKDKFKINEETYVDKCRNNDKLLLIRNFRQEIVKEIDLNKLCNLPGKDRITVLWDNFILIRKTFLCLIFNLKSEKCIKEIPYNKGTLFTCHPLLHDQLFVAEYPTKMWILDENFKDLVQIRKKAVNVKKVISLTRGFFCIHEELEDRGEGVKTSLKIWTTMGKRIAKIKYEECIRDVIYLEATGTLIVLKGDSGEMESITFREPI